MEVGDNSSAACKGLGDFWELHGIFNCKLQCVAETWHVRPSKNLYGQCYVAPIVGRSGAQRISRQLPILQYVLKCFHNILSCVRLRELRRLQHVALQLKCLTDIVHCHSNVGMPSTGCPDVSGDGKVTDTAYLLLDANFLPIIQLRHVVGCNALPIWRHIAGFNLVKHVAKACGIDCVVGHHVLGDEVANRICYALPAM